MLLIFVYCVLTAVKIIDSHKRHFSPVLMEFESAHKYSLNKFHRSCIWSFVVVLMLFGESRFC